MSPTEESYMYMYVQIEKGPLAFTWACKCFSEFLIGLRLHTQTDHRPFIPLFSMAKKGIRLALYRSSGDTEVL